MGFRGHHGRKGKNVEFNDVEGAGGWVDLCNSQERALGMAFFDVQCKYRTDTYHLIEKKTHLYNNLSNIDIYTTYGYLP